MLAFQGVLQVTIPMVDASGSLSQFQMNFALSPTNLTTLPTVLATIVGGVPALEALSGASARGLTVSLPYREDDVTPPDPGSRVERVGRFDLINTNGQRFAINIPAIDPALVDNLGYIDLNNPLVQAFTTFLFNSSASDSRGVEIGGILDARELFRRTTRTRAPRIRA